MEAAPSSDHVPAKSWLRMVQHRRSRLTDSHEIQRSRIAIRDPPCVGTGNHHNFMDDGDFSDRLLGHYGDVGLDGLQTLSINARSVRRMNLNREACRRLLLSPSAVKSPLPWDNFAWDGLILVCFVEIRSRTGSLLRSWWMC